jgi:hypothetical protein
MAMLDVGESNASTSAANISGPVNIGGAATSGISPVVWIVVGVLLLFGVVAWFKSKGR